MYCRMGAVRKVPARHMLHIHPEHWSPHPEWVEGNWHSIIHVQRERAHVLASSTIYMWPLSKIGDVTTSFVRRLRVALRYACADEAAPGAHLAQDVALGLVLRCRGEEDGVLAHQVAHARRPRGLHQLVLRLHATCLAVSAQPYTCTARARHLHVAVCTPNNVCCLQPLICSPIVAHQNISVTHRQDCHEACFLSLI